MHPDLKKEQKASSERPPCRYSIAAKVFFRSIDVITGRTITLPKVKLIEMLASVPYRAWEARQYARMTRRYRERALVREARTIMAWAREAQDNEYWHLLVVNGKMKEEGIKDPVVSVPACPASDGRLLWRADARDGIGKHPHGVPVQRGV